MRWSTSWPDPGTTVLLVEDLHWVDDATIDVLAYLARRLDRLPAVLVLTYRDDSVPARAPGAPAAGRARRLPGAPAGAGPAVGGGGRRSGRRVRLGPGRAARADRGQPLLRHRGARRARGRASRPRWPMPCWRGLRRLGARCRDAVEQLSVVPTLVDFELAETLLGDGLDALAEAEERGHPRGADGRAGVPSRAGPPRRRAEPAAAASSRAAPRPWSRPCCAQPAPDLARLVHHADAGRRRGHREPASRRAPRGRRPPPGRTGRRWRTSPRRCGTRDRPR